MVHLCSLTCTQQQNAMSHQGLRYPNFQKRSSWNIRHYLQNPAAALKLIKRTRPDQTPPRPSLGAAASRNADETAPTKN